MKRVPGFEATGDDEAFLERLNDALQIGEIASREAQPLAFEPRVVLVLGAPRSGTTVLTQWISDCGLAYPSNLLARFHRAPYIGGMIQRLLVDPALGYREELAVGRPDGFKSDFGKTAGLLAPHEFSFFWRDFFGDLGTGRQLTASEWEQADTAGFRHALGLLQLALGRPLVLKGLVLQFNLKELAALLPGAVFVHTVRDPVDNIMSLYNHRLSVGGSLDEWISLRPPEHSWLKELAPIEQVAGQVLFSNAHIRRALGEFPTNRRVSFRYEAFCKRPDALIDFLADSLGVDAPDDFGSSDHSTSISASQAEHEPADIRLAEDAMRRVVARAGELGEPLDDL